MISFVLYIAGISITCLSLPIMLYAIQTYEWNYLLLAFIPFGVGGACFWLAPNYVSDKQQNSVVKNGSES